MNTKFTKECEYCKKEFNSNVPNKKYCNQYCANKAKQERRKNKQQLERLIDAAERLVINAKVEDIVPISEINVVGHQKFIGKEIPVIEGGFGEGKRCLTDKAIAEIHNMEVKHVRELINRNTKRFKEGLDLIDLKVVVENDHNSYLLKNLDFTQMQISKSQHIYLLSERGYAKLIKIMDTDLAWEIHDELIDRYFTMRQDLKEIKRTREEELVLEVYRGGSKAIDASKELTAIEVQRAKDEAEKEKELLELRHQQSMLAERQSRNQMIGVTTVVENLKDILRINDLNSVLFNRWLAEEKNLGEYVKYPGEKKRRFEPNEGFFRWVALEGYSFTGKTRDGRKTNVQYSTAMVERIVKYHADSLIRFVRVNAVSRKSEEVIELFELDI